MTINNIKMLVIGNTNKVAVPALFNIDLFDMKKIKGHFAVVANGHDDLLEFSNLYSALKYIRILTSKSFLTKEFYDNFRIVELTPKTHRIRATIINLVDYFDIIIKIKDNELDKDEFKDTDFIDYYNKYSELLD